MVELTDLPALRRYPFLFMTAEGHYELDHRGKDNLGRYLHEGGFLFMDDCVFNGKGDFFYESSFPVLEDIFGKGSEIDVPREHELFHNVYDLGSEGQPSLHGVNHGPRGVVLGDRLAVFLSSSDIHCGWTRTWFGRELQD